MDSVDWALAMGVDDKPDGSSSNLPMPSNNASNRRARLAESGASHPPAHQHASRNPRLPSGWSESYRMPARGLVLAIPAGIALWAVAIYLVANLL